MVQNIQFKLNAYIRVTAIKNMRTTLLSKISLKSSLLELLILFVAITMGFLVENYRETYLEEKRSERLLNSLHVDLQGDIIRFDEFTGLRKLLIDDVYHFIDDVEKRGLLENDMKQQKLFAKAIFNWTYFEPNTANIEQIISSGALRYLGDDELIHQIGMMQSRNLLLMDRQEREQEYFLNYLQPMMHQYYNFKWLNKNYVRNWQSFPEANENLVEVNPKEQRMMLWKHSDALAERVMNLFENYVFILRSSHVVNYDEYIEEMQHTIEIIDNKCLADN